MFPRFVLNTTLPYHPKLQRYNANKYIYNKLKFSKAMDTYDPCKNGTQEKAVILKK